MFEKLFQGSSIRDLEDLLRGFGILKGVGYTHADLYPVEYNYAEAIRQLHKKREGLEEVYFNIGDDRILKEIMYIDEKIDFLMKEGRYPTVVLGSRI
jgi:hypothetical protein